MQNQPFASFGKETSDAATPVEPSQRRLTFLAILFVAIAAAISLRVYHVQVVIADAFLAPWEQTTLVETTIPARNGRILSRDGVVLAYDRTRYDIGVEYRWLEVPFDEVWLRRKVYSRLTPEERDDPAARERIELELQQERSELFNRLSEITGLSSQQLEEKSKRIQRQIERMVAAVEANRESEIQASEPQALDLKEGWRGIANTIQSELTTPPRRFSGDPIILKEELDSHILIENVPLDVVAAIQSSPHRFKGVDIKSRSTRVYPLEDVAAHLIGIRKQKLEDEQAFAQGGIEQQYFQILTGQPGKKIERTNRLGEIVATEAVVPPQDGQDTVLNIDSRLQQTAEQLLDDALGNPASEDNPVGGAVLVMNLWTGDLLAAAAAPRYSLQTMLKPTQAELDELLQNPNQPFFPRVSRMAIPPGSVFKIVTSAAALENGEVTPDEILDCRGYLNHPSRHRCQIFRNYGLGHGEILLADALCQSCNVFFYEMAQRMGGETLSDWSSKFGYGKLTEIDLPSEDAGFLPHPQMQTAGQRWHSGSEMQLAIGQGALLVTPLQVTRMMAAIGNGGYLPKPRLVRDQTQDDRNSLTKIDGLSDRTLTTIRHGMEMVVHHPEGTGIAALTPSMTIAAKTGTAEVNGKPDHAWFAGFAPVESPRIAFCVVLEHGGSGGAAGPIVKKLMTEMIGLGYLQPQWDERSTNLESDNHTEIVKRN